MAKSINQTAKKLFKKLPKKISSQAITNTTSIGLKKKYRNIYTALFHSFQWDTTPEGFEYWKSIREKYK